MSKPRFKVGDVVWRVCDPRQGARSWQIVADDDPLEFACGYISESRVNEDTTIQTGYRPTERLAIEGLMYFELWCAKALEKRVEEYKATHAILKSALDALAEREGATP
jgi:hypothetical protein